MTGADLCIQRALDANALREPVFRSMIQSLQLPVGSHGLDAGCGIGLQALLLAQAVRPDGRVTGMDIDSESLAFGEDHVRGAGYAERITFCAGDVSSFPFAEHSFDWAWSSDCIGYPVGELKPLLEELVRVVRPGGSVFILGWTSQQLLPGFPLLEARLNAKCSAYIPFIQGKNPELNFLRARRWFREVGLEEIQAQTFVGEVRAPLSSGERAALMSLFEMLWVQPQTETAPQEDWNAYRRLCEPGSPDFILDVQDYYAFFTYSMFRGKVPDV